MENQTNVSKNTKPLFIITIISLVLGGLLFIMGLLTLLIFFNVLEISETPALIMLAVIGVCVLAISIVKLVFNCKGQQIGKLFDVKKSKIVNSITLGVVAFALILTGIGLILMFNDPGQVGPYLFLIGIGVLFLVSIESIIIDALMLAKK